MQSATWERSNAIRYQRKI